MMSQIGKTAGGGEGEGSGGLHISTYVCTVRTET